MSASSTAEIISSSFPFLPAVSTWVHCCVGVDVRGRTRQHLGAVLRGCACKRKKKRPKSDIEKTEPSRMGEEEEEEEEEFIA